jgi:hypothetical protein
VETTTQYLGELVDIYHATMARNEARRDYYFPRDFFETIIRDLPDQQLFHVWHEDELISTELLLVSARFVYSFLGGTRDGTQHLRPNDLLKHAVVEWAQKERKSAYVLGGGYRAGDGVFRYKCAFAPRGVVPFYVGNAILDEEAYSALNAARQRWEENRGNKWTPAPGFFPRYRG